MPFALWSATALAAVLTWAPSARADGTPERRARLAQADEEEKERLSQNFQRFQRLDPAQQERLRRLNDDLETAADKDDLRKVMQNYHEWLSELPAGERAELMSLAPEERLKKIDKLRAAQRRREATKLSPQDLEVVENWMQKYEPLRRKWLQAGRQHEGGRPAAPDNEGVAAIQELRQSLSAEAREKLDKAADKPGDRAKLLWGWFEQARRHGGAGGPPAGFHRPTEDELQNFLKHEVSDEQRSRLLSLPYDEMQRELRRLWLRHEFSKNRGSLEGRSSDPRADRPNEDRRRWPPSDGKGALRGPGQRPRGENSPPDAKP